MSYNQHNVGLRSINYFQYHAMNKDFVDDVYEHYTCEGTVESIEDIEKALHQENILNSKERYSSKAKKNKNKRTTPAKKYEGTICCVQGNKTSVIKKKK